MKNFTNNFKQFTSRLSARWLIMALMLLLGTSSAWAVGYTKNLNIGYNDGSGDHWTTNINDGGTIALGNLESAPKLIGINAYTTKWQNGNICSGQVSVENTTYNSTSVNWNYNNSNNDQEFWFSINRTLSSTAGEHSITVTVTIKGGTTSSSCASSYIRTFKITYNIVAPETYSATIKFKRPAGWSNTPNIHIFNNSCSGSPFVNNAAMEELGTANDGSVWYEYDYTITTTCANATIMFNNGGWSNGKTNENLTITWGEGCCLTGASSTNVTSVDCPVFCNAVAKPTIQLASSPVKCGVNVTAGFITIDGYDDSKYTYTLNKDGNATTIAYGDDGYAITEAGSYTVTADVSENTCGAQTSDPQEVTITDNTHTINSFTVTAASDKVCEGSSVKLTATHVNGATYAWYKGDSATPISGATAYTYSPIITENSTFKVVVTKTNNECPATAEAASTIQVIELPAAPTLNPNSTTVCSGVEFILPGDYNWYEVSTGGTKLNSATISGGITSNKSYWAEAKNASGCVSEDRAQYTVTVNPTPTITGKSVTQPNTEITLTSIQGVTWSVNPTENVILTDNGDGTATFSASVIGEFVVSATNGTCSDTHVVTVADAFYVYMRQPKKGENAYNNFYYPTENPTQGGDLFYKEYASIPPAEGYTDYNTGGVAHDIIFTDCDGYVWYGFKASDKLVDGTNYFTVRAPNEGGNGGYYTHTYLTKPDAMTSDIYYTMNENASGSSQGWYITKVSAPYAGPKVHASGSTTLGTDEFAALYVTDCSGKEITGYQWYKDGQPYSSVCSYVGKKGSEDSDAGETNNIRPTVAGNYSCTVTYEDGNTATSAAVEIDGTYNCSFTSNIPVLVVNTGGKGFPNCTGLSGQTASRNASIFKAKRSVDVKIYDGETLVYDRKARMNYRGSSSLNFVKKSYAFCPGDANCGDADKGADYVKTAKLNMLGVGTACDKDWVLYAAAADPSLMRNRLVFDSYKAMTGTWGVNSRYVELIVDGVYKGVYVFMDKITMNKDRVKVDEDKGFIVKFDKTDKEDRVGGLNGVFGDEKTFATDLTGRKDISTYDTSVDQLFEIEYPEKDDYPTGWGNKTTAIKNMFNNFENALKDGDFTTVQQYIDYTSWADWFIINEYTKNVDAYRASCIFVYTGEAGAKIEARPLWDQELSFNNTATTVGNGKACNSTSGLLVEHDEVYKDGFPAPFWFTGNYSTSNGQFTKDKYKGLLDDPCFVQVVKERWNIHQSGALSKKSLEDLVDEYEDDLAPVGTIDNAQTRETAFWNGKSRGTCDCSYDTSNATATGYQNKSFAESTGTITNWIADGPGGRREGLTTAINGLTGASFSIQILPSEVATTPWEPVEIAVSVTPEGYDYTLEYTGEHKLGEIANAIIEEEGDKITYRIPRPDDWGTGNESFEGERTDIEYGIKATLNVQDGTTVCGSQAAPSSTGKIILQDEPNEKCD